MLTEKTPYGKFKTAEEYAKAKELWNDFEGLCQPSIIPEPYDYKKAANEDSWKENKEKMIKIHEILKNKKDYIGLLLLADEQEDMIDRYLEKGQMFVLDDDGVKAECVVTDEDNGLLEIKNIATDPKSQGKGYGRKVIDFVCEKFRADFSTVQVGTGDSPLTIPFYEKCGFKRHHAVKNFFTENYDHPIFEAGVQLVDMIYLQKELGSKED